MARKKGSGSSKKAAGGRPFWRKFFHFLWLRPVRLLILFIVALLVVRAIWPAVTATSAAIWGLLGWGLLFIGLALGTLFVQFRRRKFGWLWRYWNLWLGIIAYVLAVWGLLGLMGLGGDVGRGIVGQPAPLFISILLLLMLTAIGLILIAPDFSYRAGAAFVRLARKLLRRRGAPRASQPEAEATDKPAALPRAGTPLKKLMSRPPPLSPPRGEDTEEAESGAPKDARQVAQEVWKKYGQSSGLIEVDGWKLPPPDILDRAPEVEFSQADNAKRAKLIEDALTSYGVDASVVQINTGPTVTQFGVEPGWDRKLKEIKEKDKDGNVKMRLEEVSKTRVKVERITSLANDLALALAAPTIRIEAPVPGKSIIGIEVPNTISGMVSLRGVVETSAFQKVKVKSKLALALGKGAGGEAVAGDLGKMPHLLIAGATGSGKTVCLNTIIACLLAHATPYDVRFIMIDPKRVELTPYNSIPHLAAPVIVDANKALTALRWLNQEMDQRYQSLATAGARNIEGYNKSKQGEARLPYIVVVVDELADLMMAGFDEVEHIICRLAQLARAVGIHLVVATQRPSVDVITGLIKANFPTRISFAVTSQVDSRTILDGGGAEKLLGKGDMLYMPTEAAKPKRLQGCFVSDGEIERLVYFWNSQQQTQNINFKIDEAALAAASAKGDHPADALMDSARQLAREHEHVSTSFLQRHLRIGYPRAARLMDALETEGFKRAQEEEEAGQGRP